MAVLFIKMILKGIRLQKGENVAKTLFTILISTIHLQFPLIFHIPQLQNVAH